MDDIFFHSRNGPNKKIVVHNNQMNTQQQQVFMVLLVFGILLLTTLSPHHNRAETLIDILKTKTTGWGGTLGAIGGVGMGLAVLATSFAGVPGMWLMPAVAGTLGRVAGNVIEGREWNGGMKREWNGGMKREWNGGKEPKPPRNPLVLDERVEPTAPPMSTTPWRVEPTAPPMSTRPWGYKI
jgi:hypothetical protein